MGLDDGGLFGGCYGLCNGCGWWVWQGLYV